METQAASWKLEAGTYEFTREDGTRGVNTVAADGTYSIAYTGGKTETGTWAEENGKTVFGTFLIVPRGQRVASRIHADCFHEVIEGNDRARALGHAHCFTVLH